MSCDEFPFSAYGILEYFVNFSLGNNVKFPCMEGWKLIVVNNSVNNITLPSDVPIFRA